MLNAWEELSCGALLAQFRRAVNQPARTIAAALHTGIWNESKISDLEHDNTTRPTRSELDEFADLYGCTAHERSFLWRAADHLPAGEEIEAMRRRVQPYLDARAWPAYVLDHHYHVVAWNAAFAAGYGPAAGSAGWALTHDFPLLQLLWSRQHGLRTRLNQADWQTFTHFVLVRFWRTTRPLIQRSWNRSTRGEPDWLLDQLRLMEDLPAPDDEEFRRWSDDIRYRLEHNRLDESVHLTQSDGRVDRLLFNEDGRSVELVPDLLSDARFLLWQHVYV